MRFERNGPAVRASTGGPVVDRAQYSSFDALDVYSLGAVAVFPAARARLRELGAAPVVLFTDELAAAMADALVDEAASVTDALAAAGSTSEALRLLRAAMEAVEAMERAGPRGPAWAVYVVERLCVDRAREWAPEALRWGAEAIARKWWPPAHVRAVVDRVLQLAAGEGRAA